MFVFFIITPQKFPFFDFHKVKLCSYQSLYFPTWFLAKNFIVAYATIQLKIPIQSDLLSSDSFFAPRSHLGQSKVQIGKLLIVGRVQIGLSYTS